MDTQNLMSSLLQKLQQSNPEMASSIMKAMDGGTNPEMFLKQVLSKTSKEQMQGLLTQAGNLGVPKEILSKLQNLN